MAYRSGNYRYVVEDSFDPFSLQERFYPVGLYKSAYDEARKEYLDLQDKTNVFKYLSETLPEGSRARQIFEGYVSPLDEASRDFSRNGLSMSNQSALLGLRGRYKGEIGRLEDATARRKADVEEQRKLYLQDPTRMFSKEADMTTLDNYLDIEGQMPYKSYSGALLAQQASTAAATLAKGITDYTQTGQLDDYTKMWIKKSGLSPAQVAMAISDPSNPNNEPILNQIVESVVNSSGIPTWGSNATTEMARNYARQGLWSAVGQTTAEKYDDYGARLEAQLAKEKALADYKAQKEAAALAGGVGVGNGTLPINVDHLVSPNAEGQEGRKQMDAALKKLGFNTDLNGKFAKTVSFSHYMPSLNPSGGQGSVYNYKGIHLWDSKQKLLNEDEFVKANKKATNYSEADLRDIYRNDVMPAINTVTGGHKMSKGYSWTASGILNAVKKSRESNKSGALTLGTISLPVSDPQVVMNNIIGRTETNSGELSGIQEIKSWNDQGDLKFSGKNADREDFVDKDGKLKGAPQFFAPPSTNAKGYIIMKMNGKYYGVPREKLGSIGNATYNPGGGGYYYNLYTNPDNAASTILKFMQRGYTLEQARDKYKEVINSSGAQFIRENGAALGLEYQQDPYKLNTTSESVRP